MHHGITSLLLLCDSVRPASPQVQGHPVHFSQTRRCSCLACGKRSPIGEGRDRAGPSSRYEVGVVQPRLHCAQERWWVTTDLGSASFEPCSSQAAVQDVDAETHFWMRPSPRLVCSDRPEGRILSCLDPPATQAIPAFRVRGTGVSVQGPALRAVPVASRLHQSRGGGPCPPERTRCAHSQLPRRLAHTRTYSAWPIPLRKDLLSQRRGTLWHPRPDLWKLHVWSLDGTRRF